MPDPLFPDVKPFPANPRAQIGANLPPLEERIVADFDEALAEAGITARVEALVSKGAAPNDCADMPMAGRYGDYLKLCRAAETAIEEEREKLNRPILTAQRNLKGRADSIKARLATSAANVKAKLDTFMAAERKRVADEEAAAERQRQAAIAAAQEQARKDAEAARAKAIAEAPADEPVPEVEAWVPEPVIDIAPVKVAAPVALGEYGSRVGSKTVWHHEIQSVRQLPDAILKHEKVVAAINQVVGAQVRGGTRTLKGVRIWSTQETNVR